MALVVTPEEVARRLGLPQPLSEQDRWTVEQALTDAQSDLEAYLGRPVTPQTYTETGLRPYIAGNYRLKYAPVISMISATAEVDTANRPTGYYTVTYVAGLDGLADPVLGPIRRFTRTHAMYSPEVQLLFRRLRPDAARRITSLGLEGQNVGYSDTYAVSDKATEMGFPGGLPTLKSCDRWRLAGRRVVQGMTQNRGVWPHDGLYRPGYSGDSSGYWY